MSKHNGHIHHTGEEQKGFSRRLFMKSVGSGAAGTALLSQTLPGIQNEAEAASHTESSGPGAVSLTLHINGKEQTVKAEPRETLLDVLRNRLDLTGSKLICGHGSCGGCTVLIDGKAVYGCLQLAVKCQGKKIITIEGLANGDELHPVQDAFIETDALQCGFCTPGFIMSMAAVFNANPTASLDEVKLGIAGNICRCGTYTQMFKAAELVRKRNGG